nr:uncharacterized mitochondrial protein AtMg00810-like [Tanacetum cinerariifolium]
MCTEFEKMMHKNSQMSYIGELTFFLGLQVTQKDNGIFISQDKYVDEILKKFGFLTVKTASTPMETLKPLIKDENVEDVDVHLYTSMFGLLLYLTSSRPDIMFAVCACAKFQVTPKVSHLHVVKRIFKYLKGQPKLVLWYLKDSPFNLEAYTDSDYAGASLDRKSTTGGCQFFRSRLISWQCKKKTVVANSTTKAEYVTASNCCRQDNQFDGRILIDPHRHVANFLKISNLFQYGENQEEAVMLRTLPFSLSKEAKTWLHGLDKGTITSWNEFREAFISRYFSLTKFRRLLNGIQNFRQLTQENDPTQGILDAGGIFLYNTINEAFKILDDKVILKLDFSDNSQNPEPKTIVSSGGINFNSSHAILVEKFEALITNS